MQRYEPRQARTYQQVCQCLIVRREMARVYREARGGIIDSSEAGRLAYILTGIGKLIEATEIEKRLSQMKRTLLK